MAQYDVCVVGGCGHVGLPLAILFAQRAFRVCIYDVDEKALETVSNGKMPFLEEGAEEALKAVIGNTLFAASDPLVISKSTFVVVVIGTPVDEHLNPKFTLMKRLFSHLLPYFKDGQTIILRSTVFPGTTEKINEFFKENGLTVHVTYCPERVAQGKAIKELVGLPQIVSGFEDKGIEEVTGLFKVLTHDIIVLTPVEAELAKLFTNTWRYIQFAIANQFYTIAINYGLDFYRIYEGMRHNYPRAESLPPAGFTAGPCLLKDTMQVAASNNDTFFLGHAAMLINEGLPNLIVQRLKDRYPLKEKVVGILGMAFKPNSDDKRESLSYKLKKILEIEAKNVVCSDVYIHAEDFVSPEKLLSDSDIVIVAAPHREYATLPLKDKVIVDVWNFYGKGGLF